MTRALVAIFIAACLPLMGAGPKPAMPVVTTEHMDFAPGGTITINGSSGELNVEGWDRAEVEITVTRSTYRPDTQQERDLAKRQLEAIKVTTERKSPTELVINTALPARSFWAKVGHCNTDVQMDYRIRVPRDSKLLLRQSTGDIVLYDVAGEIDAYVRTGDIIMQLPAAGQYSFDAQTRFGDIYSDFTGKYDHAHITAHSFSQTAPAPAKKISLRVHTGTIKIQKVASATP